MHDGGGRTVDLGRGATHARRRPLTTLNYIARARRRGGLPAVHLTRDRLCREGGSNSHERVTKLLEADAVIQPFGSSRVVRPPQIEESGLG